ncbi:MAG: hypothetical protein ACJ754_13240 [Pyrinomonadaceae bacterium]
MIAVDNTFLTLMLHPEARPPLDPSTGQPVSRLDERIELLINELEEDGETLIIPTPVLSEFLILAGNDGPKYLTEIDKRSIFKIEPFDIKAAVELAAIELGIRGSQGKKANKRADAEGTWAKIKFDRQIVTIAKVNGASKIYSDDTGVEKFAARCGIKVVKTWELPLPEVEAQQDLFMHELGSATEYGLGGALEADPMKHLEGWAVEPNGMKESKDEKESAGTEEATEPANTGVSTVPRLGTSLNLSPEEGSGAGEGKAGKGQARRPPLEGEVAE